ncbi:MAG: lysoplasmalogenase [Clostridia bacterium]|nr:lysoplasmalogenase [Clostridia bacterium]
MKLVFILVSLVYFALLYASIKVMYRKDLKKYTLFKSMTSAGFMLLAVISFFAKDRSIVWFFPAFLCCFLGDYYLAIAKTENGGLDKRKFAFGASAFKFAHLVFCFGLFRLSEYRIGFLFAVFGVLSMLHTYIANKTGAIALGSGLKSNVIYSFLVASFFGFALDNAINNGFEYHTVIITVAALMFFASDTILCYKYFGKKKRKWYVAVELTLYYGAMFLLATYPMY